MANFRFSIRNVLLLYNVFNSTKGKRRIFCVVVFELCFYYLIKSIFLNKDKSPQITINHQGIITKGTELIPWNQVEDERIEYRQTGRYGLGQEYYLHIELP